MTKRNLVGVLLLLVTIAGVEAATRVGLDLSARGFLALGVRIEHDVLPSTTIVSGVELPVGLIAMRGIATAGRLHIGLRQTWNAHRLCLSARPGVELVWHRQELGAYRAIRFRADAIAGYAGVRGGGVGALIGIEYNPVMHYTPAPYVVDTFQGTGQEPPVAGWYASPALNVRIGMEGSLVLGSLGRLAVASGLRFPPRAVVPASSGFPYGNLPFFFEVTADIAVSRER